MRLFSMCTTLALLKFIDWFQGYLTDRCRERDGSTRLTISLKKNDKIVVIPVYK